MYCLWLWNRPELHSQNGWLCAMFTTFEIYFCVMDKNRLEINEFFIPSWDFHGFSTKCPTSSSSSSMMRRSLGNSRYVFGIYTSRSSRLEGVHTMRVAARDRKTASKVACFAFWRTRRCVRTYHRIEPATLIAPRMCFGACEHQH